jgi:hypothetical protein
MLGIDESDNEDISIGLREICIEASKVRQKLGLVLLSSESLEHAAKTASTKKVIYCSCILSEFAFNCIGLGQENRVASSAEQKIALSISGSHPTTHHETPQ